LKKASLAFDLGKAEALKLTLAAEEIFTYLCKFAKPKNRSKFFATAVTITSRLNFL